VTTGEFNFMTAEIAFSAVLVLVGTLSMIFAGIFARNHIWTHQQSYKASYDRKEMSSRFRLIGAVMAFVGMLLL